MVDEQAEIPRLVRFITGISRKLATFSGLAILATSIPITVDVLARRIFASPVFESYEISTYVLAVAVSLSYSYALCVGAHIRVTILVDRLPAALQRFTDLMAIATLAAASLVLADAAIDTVFDSFAYGARANTTLGTPLILPQGLWAAGLIWFSFVSGAFTLVFAYLLINRRNISADTIFQKDDL